MPDVTLEHFKKAAREIGAHGDNDTLPFDLDTRFISDEQDAIAEIAFNFFERLEKDSVSNAKNIIDAISIFHERLLTPAGISGFRITTKIHPFWNVYINGLAISILEKLEILRSKRVHSYRQSIENERIFLREHSWHSYKVATLDEALLSHESSVVVQTDISGFYEHIYHHRLENLVSDLFSSGSSVAGQIDRIVNQMSSGRSFGLPVGGQCSRVLAEVLMNAVDGLLDSSGIIWHRYVADYTLIAENQSEAYKALSLLSRYLSDYGLSLNRTKTTFLSGSHYKNFVNAQLYSEESNSKKLKEIDLYYDPYSDNPDSDYDDLKKAVNELDVVSLLQAETFKSQPDSFLVAQISRTLEFQNTLAASQLCQTLLKPNNLNAFRASWSKIMRGISKVRSDQEFSSIFDDLDMCLDNVIAESNHLLLPEANLLHFLRTIRFKKTEVRARFLSKCFRESELVTIKKACIDCWRQWKDRPSFRIAANDFNTCHSEIQKMLWISSFSFGDEGEHLRISAKAKIESSWKLGIETTNSKSFSALYKKWINKCDF